MYELYLKLAKGPKKMLVVEIADSVGMSYEEFNFLRKRGYRYVFRERKRLQAKEELGDV